ncbi:MAG: MBL fold metallo-hydrolase [Desertifilum sp.]|nr:MBL fold metallo-hydrolase [Desertifilum sp.]
MSLKTTFFKAGYCTHPEAVVIRDGRWKTTQFPALFALISHPQFGAILFDTGYSDRFFQETRQFPLQLYALTTPVYFKPEDSAVRQLQHQGIEAAAVRFIIISHFHADHIGGLRDFPNAQFICFKSAYEAVKYRRGISALKAGFLVGLLPKDFEQRAIFVEDKPQVALPLQYTPFETGFDLLGDASLLAVELPGHATGQLGLFFSDASHQSYFLIADACWLSRAYQEFIKPHPIANLIFSDGRQYGDTLSKIHQLHQLNPELKIIPTHCPQAWDELSKLRAF